MHDDLYRIRYAECDLFGHLNHTGYFDYLQEGLLAVAETLGFGRAYMGQNGYLPLITAASLEYLRPLFFRQRLRLLPSIVEAGRCSCRLDITLQSTGEGGPAARCEAEVVLTRAGEPALIPIDVAEGLATLPPAPGRLGLALPDRTGTLAEACSYTTTRRITSRDTNPSGLLSMAAGISFFEDCGLQQCHSVGWPFSRMAAEGIGIVSRRYTVRFLKPLPMDSRLTVRTWLHSPRGVSIQRDYSMTLEDDSHPAVLAHCSWIFFDLHRQRPMRIPEVFHRDFSGLICPSPI